MVVPMSNRALFFKVALTIMCVLILVFTIQLTNTTAETITSFDGPTAEKTINFYTRGDSAELSMTIPDDVPVSSASVDVSTADLGTGYFCEQPSVDFGPDGDVEWRFAGAGYGPFGEQSLFHTNNSRATHTFTGAGSQSNTKIKMPKDATVSSAYLGVNGRLNANTPSRSTIGTITRYMHGPAVDDLNGDGAPDIATTQFYSTTSEVHWWKSTGGASPSFSKTTLASNLYYPNDVDIGDVTGDGNKDIVVASNRYKYSTYDSLIWFKNGGGLNPSFTRYNSDKSIGLSDVKIAKINGDTSPDIFAGSYYSGMYWYQSSGGATPTWTKKTIDSGVSYIEQIDAGDVDGDGDQDVCAVTYGWGSASVFVYLNNNNGATWTKVQLDSGNNYGSDVGFADIDMDGDLDVVASFYYDDTIKWYENKDKTPDSGSGDGSSWAVWTITTSFYRAHGFDCYDIAGDGYMDVVCTGYYGNKVYWYEAPDDPRTGAWTRFTVDSNLPYGWDCVIKDITQDGKPEVVATKAYYNQGGVYRYSLSYSYPTNPSIQFGGTGSTDWSYSGTCQGEHMTNDVTTKIQSLVDSGSPMVDSYGNKYVEFPVKVSLGSAGRLTLQNLEIRYNLTVTVDKNPHNGDLKTELNELVPDYGKGDTTIFINVHSDSSGAIKVSGMNVEYNGFPVLKDNIPDKHVDEDSVTENLLDVRQYFEDDYASADELEYNVHMSSDDMSKVRVTLVNNYFVKADCSQWPNWNGEVSVYISARDNGELGLGGAGKRTTDSNVFKVIVDPINDPPQIGSDYLQNQLMNEGETKIVETSLDDKEYFTDIEANTLYYKGVVDPDNKYDGEELSVSINSNNQIVLKALNDFHGMKIPVRIYCNDANDWSSLTSCPYQDFDVTVNQLMDDKPKWGYIDTIYMVEDTDLPEAVKLTEYVSSIDVPVTALQFTIVYNVNGSQIFADIDDEAYLNLYASAKNFDGSTDMVIRASDSSNYADTTVRVIVEPVNDPPSGKIIEPTDGSRVKLGSRVLITGSASDPESIQEVEIRIGESVTWEKASGAGSWQYNWEVKSEDHKVNDKVQISMRVFDGELYSPVYSVNVTVEPGKGPGGGEEDIVLIDSDKDGVPDIEDAFWDDPSEQYDTDHDGKGDNSDPYPFGEDKAPGFTENAATQESSDSSIFSLWWLVVVLIIAEAVLIVLLMVKKFRSKRPVPTKKVIQKTKKKAEMPQTPPEDNQ
jgi:hypothetical protein